MLTALHIENIAVVKRADIELGRGFTVLTGETGAGKSIIIDSINLLLGARPSRELLRAGEENAMVSALFTDISEENLKKLGELGVYADENGELMLQRNLSSDGRTQTRLNGRSIPVSLERELSAVLINIHGQHDNQSLLRPEGHIVFLDDYAGLGGALDDYAGCYAKLGELKRRMRALREGEQDKERRIELLKYQIEDIDSARLKDGEEDKLVAERAKLQNMEKIMKQTRTVYRSLYRSEKGSSAFELISAAADALAKLDGALPEASEMADRLRGYMYEVEDIAETVKSAADFGCDDPTSALNRIEDRLDAIHKLKRKYGADIGEILGFRARAAASLEDIELSEEKLKDCEKEYKATEVLAGEKASELHALRVEAAGRLERQIMSELAFLDMAKVSFRAEIRSAREGEGVRYNPRGTDEVEFMISTNPGEPLKPLEKIASGGELSRIMLALKSAFADKEHTETLIYDEVDTGVSGKTSQKIGIKLAEAARDCQVICVTHSAQIAAVADEHLLIKKREVDGRAETEVVPLDRAGRVEELSRIMGGMELTDALRKSAEELMAQKDIIENRTKN